MSEKLDTGLLDRYVRILLKEYDVTNSYKTFKKDAITKIDELLLQLIKKITKSALRIDKVKGVRLDSSKRITDKDIKLSCDILIGDYLTGTKTAGITSVYFYKDKGTGTVKYRHSKTDRANLIISVPRIEKIMKLYSTSNTSISPTAAVYLAAVIEKTVEHIARRAVLYSAKNKTQQHVTLSNVLEGMSGDTGGLKTVFCEFL